MPATPTSLLTRPLGQRGNVRFRKIRLFANRPPFKRRSRLAAKRRVVLLGPFGEPLIPPTGLAAEMPFRFSTKYQDAETGLYSYIFRPYDPITGRWLSRDPIEEEGGINLYAMVGNDPVDEIDPLGLIDYKLDQKTCKLNVTLRASTIFTQFPQRRFLFFKSPARDWKEGEKSRWKTKAKSVVDNYYSNLPYKAYPRTEQCCICKDGVKVHFDLQFVDSGGDFVITVVPDRNHRSFVNPGRGTAEFDIDDVNSHNNGGGASQVTIVHEVGHMLRLDHPGGRSNASSAYRADWQSLMGGGMTLRLPDFDKAFSNHVSTGKSECDKWKGK